MALHGFTDPEGRSWQVWDVVPGAQVGFERTARHLPDDMAEGWLCFENATEKRRFFPIPPDWESRGDHGLWDLCRAAVPMRRRAGAAAEVA